MTRILRSRPSSLRRPRQGENVSRHRIIVDALANPLLVPIYATVSPNEVLLCSLSSNLYVSQVSVHALPKPVSDTVTRNLSTSIASALLSRRSTSDFVHVLSLPSMSLDDVADIMYHTFKVIEDQPAGRPGLLTSHALGVVLEVYRFVCQTALPIVTHHRHRNRAKSDKDPALKDILTARWQSAHDMCSLVACNAAFEDCKDNDGPDLSEFATSRQYHLH